jgi:4-amino-4-deoxy-L-arabinose transferase-like glycosyltransferase
MKALLKKYEVPLVGILLIITLFWGSFLRIYKLGNQSLWIDEGYTINAAQGVLAHGHPLLDSGQEYTPHRLSVYLTAASMKIFGFDPMNPWSARLPHALFGIISIYLIYRAMYSTTKNLWASLFAAFCFAFFPWEIAWSRQVRGYAEMQTFLIAAFLYMWAWVQTRSIKSLFLSGIMFILACLGQGVAVVALPLIVATPTIVWAYEGISTKKIELREIILGILSAAAIGVMIYRTWSPHIEALGYETTYLSFFISTFFYFLIVGWIGMFIAMRNKTSNFLAFLLPTLFTLIPGVIIMWYSPVLQFRYLLVITPFSILIFC